MDASVRRSHRPPTDAGRLGPPPPQTAPQEAATPANPARQRVLPPTADPQAPHASDGGPPSPERPSYDLDKVARNALSAGTAFGLTFGTATAIKHALRNTAGMPLPVKVAAGLLPMVSLLVSPQVEDSMRELLGTQASYPPEPSLAHDALSPLALTLMNAGYIATGFLKLPPTTLAGAAATVFKTALASVPAGGVSEADAQRRQAQARREGRDPVPHEQVDPVRKGIGRAHSQWGAAAVNIYGVVRDPSLAARRPMVPVISVTGGWTFRRVLMPPANAIGAPSAAPVMPRDGDPCIPPA